MDVLLYTIPYLAGAVVVGLLLHRAVFWGIRTLNSRLGGDNQLRENALNRSYRPLQLLIPLLVVRAVFPMFGPTLEPALQDGLHMTLHTLFVVGIAWLLIAAVHVTEDLIGHRFSVEQEDNLQARKIVTQARLLRRIAIVAISVVALGIILFESDTFRSLGTGLLASAGIVGIVVGFAAQRTIGTIVAGLQVAFTQPIRIDDVVIVEGDFGWVEEITLTYVVVRVWDQRRIVVPITQFIDQPFQNWTRETSELLGTVFLYVDHTVPFEEVRAALGEIIEASEYYDGRVWKLHVTNTTERTVELRALMSARSAPDLWELRCEVRERIVTHLQETHPEALPRVRAELHDAAGRSEREPTPQGMPDSSS
ncbi:mechanosensitive ion channel protein MscS [Longimonas halophila]|uniref:Mechanosensitive ion channel protein MscS n=1 Tax=Longimonas halophila TaxID=1469170 RepID=A0A2H3NI85_9BACT|nr:mechanosensitive ion channel domain-containing protein [Longimonas halophila]PEN05011.1 mechanosensitive ion channel protein MscS [Longimonas halophila]